MTDLEKLTLVLGGARSGKSRHAESLLLQSGLSPVYFATGQALDDEMAERIRKHQEQRGNAWRTVEAPLDLASALTREAAPDTAILVDCLTLWLSNVMGTDRDSEMEIASLVAALSGLTGPVILVSNEVGQGIVPDNALARRYRDLAGRMHQDIAVVAQRVDFVTAGLAQRLK